MTVSAAVEGADQFLATLDAATHDLDDLDEADRKAGDLLADRISANAPRETGRLAKNVDAVVVAGAVEVTIGVPYAVYVVARNPWVTRDVDAALPDLTDLYAGEVAETIATIQGN